MNTKKVCLFSNANDDSPIIKFGFKFEVVDGKYVAEVPTIEAEIMLKAGWVKFEESAEKPKKKGK